MTKNERRILACLLKTYGPRALMNEVLSLIYEKWRASPDSGYDNVRLHSWATYYGVDVRKAVANLQKRPFKEAE